MSMSIDLKPLTEETIAQMGFAQHDLWKVKIGSKIFGPFETESLRHYVYDNEQLFETAEASLNHETEWKPFWAITKFQRRKMQGVSENHPGPFWLMHDGLPKGPLTFEDIEAKIKAKEVVVTEHISTDNGETWSKIYEIRGFDRRTQRAQDLPAAPSEKGASSVEVETAKVHTSDMLAEMAFFGQQQGKVLQLKVEETALQHVKDVEVSKSLRWAVPAAATMMLLLATSGYFMFKVDDDAEVADSDELPFYKKNAKKKAPQAVIPNALERIPASTGYAQEPTRPAAVVQESRFPTHYETHEQVYEEQPLQVDKDREPADQPVVENEPRDQQAPQEHSLVENNNVPAEDQPLDAAMNGTPDREPASEQQQPVQPQIEETGDF